ncbi:hypothetical protein SAMN04488026_100482 [Aliiruegeria lutimaris]|uniref:Uncharacterized protein n=1 Tax=Aliiruegeria lutimaris TaxID=571298 RepID=A0A1G8LLL5_9RHOB|nr:hypothetical protein SAMN04488026_100482 [Aliiruegeria lutimaris]
MSQFASRMCRIPARNRIVGPDRWRSKLFQFERRHILRRPGPRPMALRIARMPFLALRLAFGAPDIGHAKVKGGFKAVRSNASGEGEVAGNSGPYLFWRSAEETPGRQPGKENGAPGGAPVWLIRLGFLYRSVFCLRPDPPSERAHPPRNPHHLRGSGDDLVYAQLQPEVAPQVLHFMQVPLRTSV